jgi:hypothetical protein
MGSGELLDNISGDELSAVMRALNGKKTFSGSETSTSSRVGAGKAAPGRDKAGSNAKEQAAIAEAMGVKLVKAPVAGVKRPLSVEDLSRDDFEDDSKEEKRGKAPKTEAPPAKKRKEEAAPKRKKRPTKEGKEEKKEKEGKEGKEEKKEGKKAKPASKVVNGDTLAGDEKKARPVKDLPETPLIVLPMPSPPKADDISSFPTAIGFVEKYKGATPARGLQLMKMAVEGKTTYAIVQAAPGSSSSSSSSSSSQPVAATARRDIPLDHQSPIGDGNAVTSELHEIVKEGCKTVKDIAHDFLLNQIKGLKAEELAEALVEARDKFREAKGKTDEKGQSIEMEELIKILCTDGSMMVAYSIFLSPVHLAALSARLDAIALARKE